MNKLWASVLFVFLCYGCAVTTVTKPEPGSTSAVSSVHVFASKEEIRKLMLGISREEAIALIGRTVVIGYELKNDGSKEYKAINTANPYRSQKITKGSDVFEVDYYLTEIRKADGVVSDEELTPLVFQANKLIGKSWQYFNEKIKQ